MKSDTTHDNRILRNVGKIIVECERAPIALLGLLLKRGGNVFPASTLAVVAAVAVDGSIVRCLRVSVTGTVSKRSAEHSLEVPTNSHKQWITD